MAVGRRARARRCIRLTGDAISIRLILSALPLGPVVEAVRTGVARALGPGDARPIDVEVVDVDLARAGVRGLETGLDRPQPSLDRPQPSLRPRRAS